jgi:hypothetical protein
MKSHCIEREGSWRVEMTVSGVRILTRLAIIVSALWTAASGDSSKSLRHRVVVLFAQR